MNKFQAEHRLELWGGIECTINRVQDCYCNQCLQAGHEDRDSDLDRVASLGITTLRYPVLWEHVAARRPDEHDWTLSDTGLRRLEELGVEPIVGLLHHGSGPTYTSLVDDDFPERFARYARAVAERYPWASKYTPVNEPLTTARFSCLYGLWYPHHRDPRSFVKALQNQIKGTILAMREIRQVNPEAQLVQTDDLGKTHSTTRLRYQAEFENERRWAAWDLLAGTLDPESPVWEYLIKHGLTLADLNWFEDHPSPTDIVGVNYYVTSERFLDHRVSRYPADHRGGNHLERYADVEAVRVLAGGLDGPEQILKEAWERYATPIAVTECHLGCTREEQVRWLRYVIDSARAAKAAGADIRAVTAWSLLGAYDWNSLLCDTEGHYESGAFDLRSPLPRETAVATAVKRMSRQEPLDPLYELPGWWERPMRLRYPAVLVKGSEPQESRSSFPHQKPLLITGATGTLGSAFARMCEMRGQPYRLMSRQEMELANLPSIERALAQHSPWAVVNAAGYVRVDDAEREREACFRDNSLAAANLANACRAQGVKLLTFSSDLVFDGLKQDAYVESDQPNPLNVYGASKLAAETSVLESHKEALVIRTSAFFGPWDEHNFLSHVIRMAKSGQPLFLANDLVVSPTYVPNLANCSLDLLLDGEAGIWHLTNEEALTWHEFAVRALELLRMKCHIVPVPHQELGWPAPRPRNSALKSERGWIMPSLDQALAKWAEEREHEPVPALQAAFLS